MNKKTKVAKLFFDISHKVKAIIGRSFEEMGITMPQGMIIGILHKQKEMKVSEISSKTGLSNSTVSGIIDRLEKNSIVKKIRSKEDKRIVNVMLSPEFKDKHKGFHLKINSAFEGLLEDCSEDEIEKILEGLELLKKILVKKS